MASGTFMSTGWWFKQFINTYPKVKIAFTSIYYIDCLHHSQPDDLPLLSSWPSEPQCIVAESSVIRPDKSEFWLWEVQHHQFWCHFCWWRSASEGITSRHHISHWTICWSLWLMSQRTLCSSTLEQLLELPPRPSQLHSTTLNLLCMLAHLFSNCSSLLFLNWACKIWFLRRRRCCASNISSHEAIHEMIGKWWAEFIADRNRMYCSLNYMILFLLLDPWCMSWAAKCKKGHWFYRGNLSWPYRTTSSFAS